MSDIVVNGTPAVTDKPSSASGRRYRITTRTRASAIAAFVGAALVVLLFAVPVHRRARR